MMALMTWFCNFSLFYGCNHCIDGLCDAISISMFVTLVFMVIIVTRNKSEKDYRKLQTFEKTGVRQRRKAFVLPVSLLVPVSAPGQLSANSGVIAMTTLFSGQCIGEGGDNKWDQVDLAKEEEVHTSVTWEMRRCQAVVLALYPQGNPDVSWGRSLASGCIHIEIINTNAPGGGGP